MLVIDLNVMITGCKSPLKLTKLNR